MTTTEVSTEPAAIFERRGSAGLITQIPLKTAWEILLTGEPVDALRAYELGLINQLARRGTAVEVALRLAEQIAADGPIAAVGSDWAPEVWKINRDAVNAVYGGADIREGTRAFIGKCASRCEDR